MKILWAKTDFLHPTNRGGQIRTLEMLRRIHRRHEVHYVAYNDPKTSEGRDRAKEYSSFSLPVNRPVPSRGSARFLAQMGANLASPLPLAVGRYRSREMQDAVASLIARNRYDAVVADFLSITPNIADLSRCVLFQHNVESNIWKRHAAHASSRARKLYFRSQAARMERYERAVCRAVRQVIAVSETDRAAMRDMFGIDGIADVPTGVDIDFFRRPPAIPRETDIVFLGAMDWLPNIDGARWFMQEVFPLIRAARPKATVAFCGRNPSAEIRGYANADSRVTVTGTVPDVRPHLWSARVSVVPLRVGGGTRLKIYESMAAGVPVVSTTVGAEGLAVTPGKDVLLADGPQEFSRAVLKFLEDPVEWNLVSDAALDLVTRHFSWDSVSQRFEHILEAAQHS